MNIIVDTCGGDNGAAEAIKGSVQAACDFDVDITLVGNETQIRAELGKYNDTSRIHVVHADGVIDNYDSPVEHVLGMQNPKVSLLNVGTEDGKGDDLRKKTFVLLQKAPVHFVGNIEARDIPHTQADIVVTDGFTGNVVLKLYEGVGGYFINMMKGMFLKNLASKIAAAALKGSIKEFKSKMDYTEYGGAPLLGVKKPVFKTHGSSKAKEFYHTIEKIKKFTESNVLDEIADCIQQVGVMEDA